MRIKFVGPSLADFIQPAKGPTVVDFLQAQEVAREARQAASEESLMKRLEGQGATTLGRTVLPNGSVRVHISFAG